MSPAGIGMHTVVIINPVSGGAGNRGGTRAQVAARVLAAEGVEGEVLVTCSAGDGFRLAKAAARQGAKLVIAWGETAQSTKSDRHSRRATRRLASSRGALETVSLRRWASTDVPSAPLRRPSAEQSS